MNSARFILAALLLLMSNQLVIGQEDSLSFRNLKNVVYAEYGGSALDQLSGHKFIARVSINYEREILRRNKMRIGLRCGSSIPAVTYNPNYLPRSTSSHLIVGMFDVMFGKRRFFFELGGGGSLIFFNGNYRTAYCSYNTLIGFRYQSYEDGIIIRCVITPSFGKFNGDLPFKSPNYSDLPPSYFGCIAGLSIGYTFSK